MSTEKTEGAEQTCSKCGTDLICVKIVREWQGKKEEKLQWQNKADLKPHFKFAGANNYSCNPPAESSQAPSSDEYLKKRQEELKGQQDQQNKRLDEFAKTAFSDEQIRSFNTEMDKLQAIERIVTVKLQGNNPEPPNPAKVGMYMKFLYDGMMQP